MDSQRTLCLEKVALGQSIRSEIDRLTELLHSRTTESSYRDKEKTSEGDLYKSASDIEKHNLSPLQENRDDGIKLQNVTATGVSSKVLEEDIASPAELAKAYMGRSSKVSPSMLGVLSQAFKEETPLLNHGVFPSKSSALSLVSKSSCVIGHQKRASLPRDLEEDRQYIAWPEHLHVLLSCFRGC